MKLLLDSAFPSDSPLTNTTSIPLDRASGFRNDRELVLHAHKNSFTAICLLGRDWLANKDIIDLARSHDVTLVVTSEDDPILGARHLLNALPRLARIIPSSTLVLVTSRKPQVLEPGD